MDLTDFLIRVIILLIPGIASDLLYRRLRGRTSRKDWEDYLEIGVFSLASYISAGALLEIWRSIAGSELIAFSALRALYDKSLAINGTVIKEIVVASVLSVPVALLASYIDEYKLINRIGRSLKATKRFGDEDVWDYIHRSPDVIWVFVRDHKEDLGYYGWTEAYSDPYKARELLLRDVVVYKNSTGAYLYDSAGIYL